MAMAVDDEDRPKKKIVHEIGQDISRLSVDELGERIALLKAEADRLAAAQSIKRATRDAADRLFKV